MNERFNTPHLLLTFLLLLGVTPILAGWELRYIIMLGGGLVFIYDLIPLIAAFRLPDRLPTVFAKARMRLSSAALRTLCIVGVLILIGQGALSFSDIDRTGWALAFGYVVLVALYVTFRNPSPVEDPDAAWRSGAPATPGADGAAERHPG